MFAWSFVASSSLAGIGNVVAVHFGDCVCMLGACDSCVAGRRYENVEEAERLST